MSRLLSILCYIFGGTKHPLSLIHVGVYQFLKRKNSTQSILTILSSCWLGMAPINFVVNFRGNGNITPSNTALLLVNRDAPHIANPESHEVCGVNKKIQGRFRPNFASQSQSGSWLVIGTKTVWKAKTWSKSSIQNPMNASHRELPHHSSKWQSTLYINSVYMQYQTCCISPSLRNIHLES